MEGKKQAKTKQKSKPHHIRVISEGSCDTEDGVNNDAKNSALITRINYILQYW